jgi:hypothetical protein
VVLRPSVDTDRLFVLWRAPDDGTHLVVGELLREPTGFAFGYVDDLRCAFDRGFRLLTEFPEYRTLLAPYRNACLFPTFAERVPSPRRPDYRAILASWGVEHSDDSLEILALSGGIQVTDRLELAAYRAFDDDLTDPLLFRIAGRRYQAGQADVRVGDPLELLHETGNPHDPDATVVLTRNGIKIGYVPRQYNRVISGILASGRTLDTVIVRELSVPTDTGRWIVRVSAA